MSKSNYLKTLEEIKGRAYGNSGANSSSNSSGSSKSVLEEIKSRANGTYKEESSLSEKGKEGWQKYLADTEAEKKKAIAEEEEKSWWEKFLGNVLEAQKYSSDNPIVNQFNATVDHYREDVSYMRPNDDWSDTQRSEFGTLYLESPEKAYAYAEEANKKINAAKEEKATTKIKNSATDNGWAGAGHTIGAIAAAPFALGDYFDDLARTAAGREITADGFVSPFEYSQAVTGGVSEHLNETGGTLDEDIPIIGGKGWGDVYGLGTSIAQSMASGYLLGPAGTLVSYFGQGAASGVDEALARGASKEQAILYGAALGTFEGVAEKVGIDNLFKLGSSSTIKGLVKNILKQAGAEGAEEGLTSILSNIADNVIMQDKSNFNLMVNELMAKGMSEADSKRNAWMSTVEDIAFDTIAGAVSGGVSGSIHTGVQTVSDNINAKKVYGENAQDLVTEALDIDPNNAYAQEMQAKLDGGKSLSGGQINRLVEANENALVSQDKGKMKAAAEARLKELGETGDVSKLAEVIVKAQMGEKLTSAEKKALNDSTYGEWAAEELDPDSVYKGFSEDYSNWAESLGTERINVEAYNRAVQDYSEEKENASATENTPAKESAVEGEIESEAGAKFEASAEDVDLVKRIATERVGRLEGWTEETSNAMIKGYDGSISPLEYNKAFSEAFEGGKNGVTVREVRSIADNAGISESTAFAAYDLGRQAMKNSTSVLQSDAESGIINTESETTLYEGADTEGLRLRKSGQRSGGANPEGQVSRVEGGTGQNQSRTDIRRIADSEAARLVNEGREVKVADLGIPGGSKYQTVVRLEGVEETTSMKKARADAEARGLTVRFFAGDNLHIENNAGEIDSVRGYIQGKYVWIRADHSEYTADQLMRHEIGHDKIAKDEVDIQAVRARLEQVVGKENIDSVAEIYARAYEGTGMTAEEIWEECICDALGDMNIFAGDEIISDFMAPMIAEVKSAAESETKAPTQTRGSPEGKASRNLSHRNKRLYVFPPYNESQSDANERATRWAHREDVKTGHKHIISYHGNFYLIEKFDSSDLGYQIVDKLTKKQYYEYIKEYGEDGTYIEGQSSKESVHTVSTLDRRRSGTGRVEHSVASSSNGQRGENLQVQRLGENEAGGRQNTSDRGGDLRSSVSNKQKYSRELDTEYLSAVKRGDMETAQRMVDEAAKKAGYTVKAYHGTSADFFTFDKSRVGKGNDQYGAGFYFATDREAANHYGSRVISSALKIEKPFTISSTNLLDAEITFTDSQAYNIVKRHPMMYDAEESPLGDYYDSYWENGAEEWMIEDLASQYTDLGYLDSDLFRKYPNELHEAVRAVTGYDGVVVNLRNGEKFYVAWFDNQMKSTEPITYDDNGNVIPLSERFNPEKTDIRYSRELDLIDYINEKTKAERANMTKAQLVAKARSELESMKVGTGEIMAVQKVADKLFEQYGGEASISEFRYAMYEATRLALMEEGFDAAYEVINEIAKEVAYNPKDLGGEAEMLSEIKREIRGSKLSVHESDKTSGEFDSYGGYGAFRKRLFGKVTLANDGVQVDAKYEELQNLYGKEFFPDVNTVSEQLMQIEKLMNTPLSDYMMVSEEELNATADEMTMSMFERLGDVWYRAMKAIDVTANKQKAGSPRELLANALESVTTNAAEKENLAKYKKEIDGLNEQERKLWDLKRQMWEKSFKDGTKNTAEIKKLKEEILKTENRINIYDSRLLRLEATSVLRDVVEREKKAAYKAAAEKGREALHRNVEGRHKTEIRHKIKGLKGKFISMLEHPTERQYVPADLVSAMVEVCKLVDTDAPLYKADGSINKAQQARNEQMQRLLKLSDEYKALKNNPDPMYSGEYDEEIQEYLDDLRREFLGKPISDMTLGELNELYITMRAIEETLRDARKLIGWGEADLVYDAGDKIIAEQKDITVKRKGKGENSTKAKFIDLSLSPLRNVKRMANYEKDSPLVKMFRELELGVRNKNKFVMEAYKSFETLTSGAHAKKYEDAIYKPYGKEYVDKEGRKFRVSKMQMMQAIMSYNRELENDKLHHVSDGGFTFADLDMLNKGKLGEAIDPKNAHSITIGALLAEQFKAELANDKWAQDYMVASEYFFDVMAKNAINNTNMVLKHRLVATGKKYIPYEVNKDFVVREITSENDIQQTISGYGMLKDIKAGATQPLIITGLNNVLERHIEQVGNIYGLAVPIRNFNKVWNVKSSDGMTTVQEAIGRNWGSTGKAVMTQAVKDVQGARIDRQSDLYKKVKGNVISSTFMLNGSVVAKQIGSLFSATSMLRRRDPARMIANLGYTMVNHKKIAAEVDKYTATAWMRRQGLSDAELHTLTTEAKKKCLSRLISKLPAVINPTKWIAGMDSMVALSLWKYAKQDVAKRTGLTGEELLKATAEFYDDVIENTQSMTDVLHRPEIQKRKDVVSDILGTFKTDLYQGAGRLQDALGECMADPSKENKSALARTVYANVMSACWGSLMTTVFALLRYKVNRYRDDEDEIDAESWLKVQGADLAADLVGYALPLFGGEVAGSFFAIMNGETPDSVDNLTLTAVQDLIDAITAVANSARDGEMPTEAAFKKIITKGGAVLGLPANNVARLIDAIRLHAEDFANGELGSFEAGLTKPNATRLYNGYIERDAEKIEKASRLYEDQKAIDTALRKALRDNDPRLEEAAFARLDGDMATYNALVREVVAEGNFDQKLIEDAFKAEYNYQKGKAK